VTRVGSIHFQTDRIVPLRGEDELNAVRTQWESWCQHPNSDLDHFLLVCRMRPEVEAPEALLIERDGVPRALLAVRLERARLPARLGYWTLARVPARVRTILYQGVLGDLDVPLTNAAGGQLVRALQSDGVHAAVLSGLQEHSPLLRTAAGTLWPLGRGPIEWSVHWELTLGDQPGFLIQRLRAKHRAWIRGRQRSLENAHHGQLSWHWIRESSDIPRLSGLMERIAADTYQRAIGAGFADDAEHRQRLAFWANRGQLRIAFLEAGGNPAAFWLGIVYRGRFHSWATGYLPELRSFEPGTLLLLHVIDRLTAEGVRVFDFGLGDASYKARFGDRSWREATVRLWSRGSPRGLFLGSCFGGLAVANRLARGVLSRSGALNRVRTTWRRALIPMNRGEQR
jgi:hypothetical protein